MSVERLLKRAGMTLIELAVTLAVVTALAVLVVPGLGGWVRHYRIKGAVRQIVSEMELAKIRALKQNREYRIWMDTSAGIYRLERGNRPDMSSDWEREGRDLSLPGSVSFGAVTFEKTESGLDHERAAEFNPHGTARPGRVVLSVSGDDEKYTITVRNITGKITTHIGEIE
jgi:prepilin-type N-terminal cleavage/methylation domain-containing protein